MMVTNLDLSCNDKMRKKKELSERLCLYRNVLSSYAMDYLMSLLELEISFVNDDYGKDVKICLAGTAMCRDIGKYNVYYRALQLLEKANIPIIHNDDGVVSRVSVKTSDTLDVSVWSFNYGCRNNDDAKYQNVSGYTSSLRIGEIGLYQLVRDGDMVQEEIRGLSKKISNLKESIREVRLSRNLKDTMLDGDNSLELFNTGERGILLSSDYWQLVRKRDEYEKRFNEIIRRMGLSMNREIEEATGLVNELLLDDYGISDCDFVEDGENNFSNVGGVNRVKVLNRSSVVMKKWTEYR